MHVPLLYWLSPMRSYKNSNRTRFSILDPDLISHQGIVVFKSPISTVYGEIERLIVPQENNIVIGDKIIITDIQFAINKVIQMYHIANSVTGLIVSIEKYIEALINSTFGKKGVINRMVLGFRATNASFDGVLLTDPTLSETFVSVSAEDASSLRLRYNDIVLVARQPVLWKQSIIPRRVQFHNSRKVIYLHPTALPGMGGDCDGDRVTIFKIENSNMAKKAESLIEENWHICKEERYSNIPLGLSLSLQAAREGRVDDSIMNSMHIDYLKFIEGLDDKDLESEITNIVSDNVRMKLELGIAGATSQKMRIIAESQDEMYSANVFSEWLTQGLLSIKHGANKTPVQYINNILENAGKLVNSIGKREFLNIFLDKKMPTDAIPIVNRLLSKGGNLSSAVSTSSVLFPATQDSPKAFAFAMENKDKHPIISRLISTTSTVSINDLILDIKEELRV